jgi:hypothetical protein
MKPFAGSLPVGPSKQHRLDKRLTYPAPLWARHGPFLVETYLIFSNLGN